MAGSLWKKNVSGKILWTSMGSVCVIPLCLSVRENGVSSLLILLFGIPRQPELQLFLSSLWRLNSTQKKSPLKSSSTYLSWNNSTYWSCHNLTCTGHVCICLGFVEYISCERRKKFGFGEMFFCRGGGEGACKMSDLISIL